MRYCLIDKVLRVEAHKSLTAIKSVALSEDIFNDHFFGNPILPGALMIESIAQAATVLIELSCEFQHKAILAMIHKAKFRELIRPGEQLTIDVDIVNSDKSVVQVDGTIRRGDQAVVECRLTFSLQPIDDFYPPRARHLVRILYDSFLRDAEVIGVDYPDLEYWQCDG